MGALFRYFCMRASRSFGSLIRRRPLDPGHHVAFVSESLIDAVRDDIQRLGQRLVAQIVAALSFTTRVSP